MPEETHFPAEFDTLHEFRTLYLKAIARGWNDPKFREDMCDEESTPDGLAFLARVFGGDRIPWDVDLTFNDEGDTWNPERQTGMMGWNLGERAKVDIFLPKPVARREGDLVPIPQDQRAMALVEHYRTRGALPISSPRAHGNAEDAGSRTSEKLPSLASEFTPHSLATMHVFREFDGMCARALALLWDEWGREAGPLTKALITTGSGDEHRMEVARGLQDHLAYVLPWNMNVVFRWSNDWWQVDEPGNGVWRPGNSQSGLARSKIRLYLPRRPAEGGIRDASQEPIALASYNQTSDRYPLTCP